jgi:hypothetical protein
MNPRLTLLFALALDCPAVAGASAGFADGASGRPEATKSEPAAGAEVRLAVLPDGVVRVRRSAAAHSLRKTQQPDVVRVVGRMPSLEDVVRMTQDSVGDDQIIDRIRAGGAIYRLTADQLLYLNQNGVHGPVIREMQATVYRTPRSTTVESVPARPLATK